MHISTNPLQSLELLALLKEVNANLYSPENQDLFKKLLPIASGTLYSLNDFDTLLELNTMTSNIKRALENRTMTVPTASALKFIKKISLIIKKESLFPQPLFSSRGLDDVAPQFMSYLTFSYNAYKHSLPPGFNALICVSKSWNIAIQRLYLQCLEKHLLLKMQKNRLPTATSFDKAQQLIKQRKAELVNLEPFKKLKSRQIDLLLTSSPHIKHVIACSNEIKNLPESCCQLETLECYDCYALKSLPSCLINLTSLTCESCSLISLPTNLTNLTSLECSFCDLESLPSGLINLTKLDCSNSFHLERLPRHLKGLTNLNCLNCEKLTSLPQDLSSLKTLNCWGCPDLESLPENLTALTKLNCGSCISLTHLPQNLLNLKSLECWGCKKLESLPENLKELTTLSCGNCLGLTKLPNNLTNLTELECFGCTNLKSLPASLPKIVNLSCIECQNLTQLPNMPSLKILNCNNPKLIAQFKKFYTNKNAPPEHSNSCLQM